MDEYAKPVEFPVFAPAACGPSAAADGPSCSSMAGVSEALAALTEKARELFTTVMDAQADRTVAMADLAPVVAGANLLERAASAVSIAATAGYARREEHDHLEDIAVPVESMRARGFVAQWAAAEPGHLLRLSTRTAGGRVATAAQLQRPLPAGAAGRRRRGGRGVAGRQGDRVADGGRRRGRDRPRGRCLARPTAGHQ